MPIKTSYLHIISLWFPVILQMGLIFFYSAQPSGSLVLEKFTLPGNIGHFGGYGLLGLLLYRAFGQGSMRWRVGVAWKCVLVALIYAVSDELHQIFVPGRQASLYDIFIDLAGVIAALAFICFRTPVRDCFFSKGRLK